jgi:hypothetical protein
MQFCEWLQATPVAVSISETWFPAVESVHVIALSLVAGTIFIVDLRLLGLSTPSLGLRYLAERVTPWTWRAFVLAAITGSLLFAANATTYYSNVPFRIKLVLLALAGINMAYFQLVTFRKVAEWDTGRPAGAARLAGVVSLVLWTGVIISGRWIGFI